MSTYEKGSATSLLVIGIIFLALVILGLFGYSTSKEIARKKEVEKEIAALQAQADNIKKENMALSERISYLGSKDYQETQAKDKLNLQSPGENVVIITPGSSTQNSATESNAPKEDAGSISEPNYQKWWKYFF